MESDTAFFGGLPRAEFCLNYQAEAAAAAAAAVAAAAHYNNPVYQKRCKTGSHSNTNIRNDSRCDKTCSTSVLLRVNNNSCH